MAKKTNPILAEVGDGLAKLLRQYTVEKTKSTIYDESAKTLDITKLMPQKDLAQILERITSNTGIYDQTFVDKFFDMSLGRIERYSDYEQIVQRIPEVSQALHMYVDSILSPDVGESDLEYNLLDFFLLILNLSFYLKYQLITFVFVRVLMVFQFLISTN